ncbi:MAG: cupin domain-containing protein [Spirochaetes bacterium]|nr:cupin domain-containing protein [Spirochaetota bacterium]
MCGFTAVTDHVNFKAKKLFGGGRRIKDGAIAVLKEGGGGPVSAHTHEHDHLFVVTAGEARIEIDGETFIVRENESFLVEGSRLHSVWNNKEDKTVMLGISLEKE